MQINEKRQVIRKIFRRPILITLHGMGSLRGNSIDISTAGMAVLLNQSLSLGTKLTANFDVPKNGAFIPVQVDGKIISAIMQGMSGFRCSVQFGELDDATRKLIEELP